MKLLAKFSMLLFLGLLMSGVSWPTACSPLSRGSAPTTWSLRIETRQSGIHRLSQADLAKAGVPVNSLNPRTFQLFQQGREIALNLISKQPNVFRPGDSLEFSAEAWDTPFSGINVYWLVWGKANGRRLSLIDGRPNGSERTSIQEFRDRLHFEENTTIWEGTPGAPAADYWFWEKFTAPQSRSYPLTLPTPLQDWGDATLRLEFQGRSNDLTQPDHHLLVRLNNTEIGQLFWDGPDRYQLELAVPAELLRPGGNSLRLEAPGDTGAIVDVAYLNRLELEYWRGLLAQEDVISFVVSGSDRTAINISGFEQPDIRLWDISNPCQPQEIRLPPTQAQTDGYAVTFGVDLAGERHYLAFTSATIVAPVSLDLIPSSDLRTPEVGADYLIITAEAFEAAVEPLLEFRRQQGWQARAVSVEAIYHTFNFGLADPKAIRDFLEYASTTWPKPVPYAVLLVGDANTDYRDYLHSGKRNQVPVHLSSTAGLGVTPDDSWYADLAGGDARPELLIGRLPGRDPTMVAGLVEKLIAYERDKPNEPARRVLLVADNNDPEFETIQEHSAAFLPPEYDPIRVYLSRYQQVDAATADIRATLDAGAAITSYVGHGSVTTWAGETLWEPTDIAALAPGSPLTFGLALDCLNGYFAQPFYYSLAEEFLLGQNRGAIAVLAPSGLAYTWENAIFSEELFRAIFEDGQRSFGEMVQQAKIQAYERGVSTDLLRIFTLIGDPAGRLAD